MQRVLLAGRLWSADDGGGDTVPTANPHMQSGWNSNNPKSSSMEFLGARERQINHRVREEANHKLQHKLAQD